MAASSLSCLGIHSLPQIQSSLTFPSTCPIQSQIPFSSSETSLPLLKFNTKFLKFSTVKTRAAPDFNSTTSVAIQEDEKQPINQVIEESVGVLKNAAKTRKISPKEIISAFAVLEKAKIDPSAFLQTLGGINSPGRTWMLIFTAEKGLKTGNYFPITAVQRFDAAEKRIENGVYLGPLGCLTFEGRFSWKKRILAFIFEKIRIKIGHLNPLEIGFKGKDEREASNKDPCFIWFYVDEEIAVARGKSGGTAFWVRCKRINTY